MSGRSKERQPLADAEIEWSAELAAVPCRGGESLVKRLFEPLGYAAEALRQPLDERFPSWGAGLYHTVRLRGCKRLSELLGHLYVLIPVLDADKHYWVGEAEVEKLLRKGEGWLAAHPDRDLIVERYLLKRRNLTRAALARLADDAEPDKEDQSRPEKEAVVEAPLKLWQQRIEAVLTALKAGGVKSVVDLGCGEGKLLQELIKDRSLGRIAGMDVSLRSLERARGRLRLDQLASQARERVELFHGSLVYRDRRLEGFDAATVCEVIEHLDPARLAAFERAVFEHARPGRVILTTPNVEYNVKFEGMAPGAFRHDDHRFEWTRAEFQAWAENIAARFGYGVEFLAIGPEDADLGPPTQMGVFSR
jgi:3' terminal RNA ribose 2'-O-methyltransferase Hen1